LITRLVAIQCTDLLLGAVPVLGDLMDVAYQADVKSAALIRAAVTRRLGATSTTGTIGRQVLLVHGTR
jgi:Domain of unknown function (DUF4112)